MEVKLTASPAATEMERLNRTADLIGAKRRILVSRVAATTGTGVSCNVDEFVRLLGSV